MATTKKSTGTKSATKSASKKAKFTSVVVEMDFARSTKNTHRFEEADQENAVIGVLYVKKSTMGEEAPESITITVEAS